MRRGWKIVLITGGVILVAATIMVVRTLEAAGQFTTIHAAFDGSCTQVRWAGAGSDPAARARLVGVEDLVIDRELGVVFFSADDRRASLANRESRGAILVAALTDLQGTMREASDDTSGIARPFHPHGIGLYTDASGRRTLMVVNHPDMAVAMDDMAKRSTIEIFDVTVAQGADGGNAVGLKHRATISSDAFPSLNDVEPIDHERFYTTVDQGSETALGRAIEVFGRLPRARVAYFDGRIARVAADGFVYANSLALNANRSELLVSEISGRTMSIFAVDAASGALSLVDKSFLGTGLDNIDIGENGDIYVAAHPKMFDFLQHAGDPTYLSPSQILRIRTVNGVHEARQIYLNLGDELSGASVAAVVGDRMLVGSVFEEKILDCRLPAS